MKTDMKFNMQTYNVCMNIAQVVKEDFKKNGMKKSDAEDRTNGECEESVATIRIADEENAKETG